MIGEDDTIAGNYDEELQPLHARQDNIDYAFALIIGEIERIRKLHGAYIWGFPIKYMDNNLPVQIGFGWEIEFNNGFCTNSNIEFPTYNESLQNAIKYFKSNIDGDRNIFPTN